MQIDKNMLDKLMNSDDEALKKQLMQIALAMGMDERKAKSVLEDLPRLKKKAEAISQNDLDKITSAIDPDKLDEIKRAASKAVSEAEQNTK